MKFVEIKGIKIDIFKIEKDIEMSDDERDIDIESDVSSVCAKY